MRILWMIGQSYLKLANVIWSYIFKAYDCAIICMLLLFYWDSANDGYEINLDAVLSGPGIHTVLVDGNCHILLNGRKKKLSQWRIPHFW